MKCIQKLCQRTKNLKNSGNCNVCDDVIAEALKKHKDLVSKKPKLADVQVDLKELVETHKKLSNGTPIDPKIVSSLILAGIVNILNQHDTVAALEERVNKNAIENVTRNVRVESLENWVTKQEKTINLLEEKLGVDKDQELNKKIQYLEAKITRLEENLRTETTSKVSACSQKDKSCKECGQTFSRNFELETHMVSFHGLEKQHSCGICGKRFYLKWRLKKHASTHESFTKPCKYFLKGNVCPFSDVGCKFLHDDKEDDEEIENISDIAIDCNYCDKTCKTQDDLITHMSNFHMDQFTHIQQQSNLITF